MCFYCLYKLIISLTQDVFLTLLLFRIVSSLNHIHLPLLMIVKVNFTLLRQFLGLYFPSKLFIRLTQDVFLMSFLFRIVSSLKHNHLPLFMINKVNVTFVKTVSRLVLSMKRIIWLNQDVFKYH